MWRTSLLCVGAIAAAVLAQTPPGREIMSGIGLVSGVTVEFKTMVDSSADTGRLGAGGISVDNDRMHRYMTDESGRSFGYDLLVQPGRSSGEHVITFAPLTGTEGPSALPLPRYPPPQVVRDRDTIALDLLVSADGRHKVVDYLRFLSPASAEPPAAKTTAGPRDFTPDDGPVKADIMRSAVFVNGEKLARVHLSVKEGATFWFAFPGRGRYILSLARHAGFRKAGEIRDNVIRFEDRGQRYEIRFASPIAGAGQAWNLYLLHDPLYRPNPEQVDAVTGGKDRLDNLIPR